MRLLCLYFFASSAMCRVKYKLSLFPRTANLVTPEVLSTIRVMSKYYRVVHVVVMEYILATG